MAAFLNRNTAYAIIITPIFKKIFLLSSILGNFLIFMRESLLQYINLFIPFICYSKMVKIESFK